MICSRAPESRGTVGGGVRVVTTWVAALGVEVVRGIATFRKAESRIKVVRQLIVRASTVTFSRFFPFI